MTPSHILTTHVPTMDVIVIGELSSATVDIYFKLREHEFNQFYALDSHSESLLNDLQTIYRGQTIIFVRHIAVDAFKWLMKQPDYQAIYFTDDNITDLIKDSSFPLHYRRRNLWRYWSYKKYLKHCGKWVSTERLAEQKGLAHDYVLPPVYKPKTEKKLVTYCYHGSMSHTREIEFVRQIAKVIQHKYDHTLLEIYGDFSIKRQFESIPRVRILHPIDWDSYYYHTCTAHIDIALVPLLDTQLNRARSEAKSFDVLRMKAYGIFSPWSKITKQLPENHYYVVKDHQLESWVMALEAAINESQAD